MFVKDKFTYCVIALIFLIASCKNAGHTEYSSKNDSEHAVTKHGTDEIFYESLFGEKYLTQGGFLNNSKDNIENNLWTYTNLNSPLVLSGHYLNGMQKGEWIFVLKDGIQLSSQWHVYNNKVTPCYFSIPFAYEEQHADPLSLKLRTINDSLGKIGIMVQIRDTTLNEEDLNNFTMKPDRELREQGYTFTSSKREIEKDKNKYFFYEYFLKDATNNQAKVYYFFGNTPSNKRFIIFTFFHQGPKEDLAQIICSLMATSLYIGNERFYNPYEIKKDGN